MNFVKIERGGEGRGGEGKGMTVCCKKRCIRKKKKWGKGKEGRSLGHKLNITDEFTNIIILSSILLVILLVKSVTSSYDLPI